MNLSFSSIVESAVGQLLVLAFVVVCVAVARLWEAVRELNEIRVARRCTQEGRLVSKKVV